MKMFLSGSSRRSSISSHTSSSIHSGRTTLSGSTASLIPDSGRYRNLHRGSNSSSNRSSSRRPLLERSERKHAKLPWPSASHIPLQVTSVYPILTFNIVTLPVFLSLACLGVVIDFSTYS